MRKKNHGTLHLRRRYIGALDMQMNENKEATNP